MDLACDPQTPCSPGSSGGPQSLNVREAVRVREAAVKHGAGSTMAAAGRPAPGRGPMGLHAAGRTGAWPATAHLQGMSFTHQLQYVREFIKMTKCIMFIGLFI